MWRLAKPVTLAASGLTLGLPRVPLLEAASVMQPEVRTAVVCLDGRQR